MSNAEFQKMLDKPSVKFILDHTMFAQLFYSMEHIEIEDDHPLFQAYGQPPTAFSDGKILGVNRKFFEGLTFGQQISLLAHETLHPALEHQWRIGTRDQQLANIAMDFEVNQILKENNFAALPGRFWIQDDKYEGWPFEKIYDDLLQNATVVQLAPGQGPPGNGNAIQKVGGKTFIYLSMPDVQECPGNDSEKQEARNRMQSKVVNAATMAEKMQGNVPAQIRRLIEKIKCPPIPWHEKLERFMQNMSWDDFEWAKPDRQGFWKTGFVTPTLYSERMGCVAIFIDTSGSISARELAEFGYHTNGVRAQTLPEQTILIYCDAAVQEPVEFYPDGMPLTLEGRGGGGTDFRPPFEWLKKNNITPDVAIYFTDMCGSFPDKDPGYPVIWVTKSNFDDEKVPFGEILNFEDK